MEEGGMFENAKYLEQNGNARYTIVRPSAEIVNMHLVFSPEGFLDQVIYEFDSQVEGNPYESLTIKYDVSKDVSSYRTMGLYLEKYLKMKSGKYVLNPEYSNYEFINLLK